MTRTLSLCYTLLFALSIAAINPFADPVVSPESVWKNPKILALAAITLLNLALVARESTKASITMDRWMVAITMLWSVFLAIGTITTVRSPFPIRSLLGHSLIGEGLLFWLLVAIFSVSCLAVFRVDPRVFRAQRNGVLLGGLLMASAVLVQTYNWTVDFTALSGRVVPGEADLLESRTLRSQMPIGFTSHRGYAGFVLAFVSLAFVTTLRESRRGRIEWMVWGGILVCTTALWMTNTRGAIIVVPTCLLALVAFKAINRQPFRKVVVATMIFGAAFFVAGTYRQGLANAPERYVPPLSGSVNAISNGRIELWMIAFDSIRVRPLLGWGFDGFGNAWARDTISGSNGHLQDRRNAQKALRGDEHRSVPGLISMRDYSFTFHDAAGTTRTGIRPHSNAHNVLVDKLLAVGVIGAMTFFALLGIHMIIAARQLAWLALMSCIAYLVFGTFWYDSAQFSHIVWWGLATGFVSHRSGDT